MEIKVIEWKATPWRRKLGRVLVTYGGLYLRLEIMTYQDSHLYVCMPEIKFKGGTKLKLCYWEEKEKSDHFQQEVLRQLYQMAGKEVDNIWNHLKEASRKKKAIFCRQD